MKNLVYIFLSVLLVSCEESATDYSGKWIAKGDNFENNLVLEKLTGEKHMYKFSFIGWRESYDPLARQNIRFGGNMSEEFFIIEIKEGKAYYSDDDRIESGEFSLYSEGEERCKLLFEFNDKTINIKTTGCHLIYGGRSVLFDGVYNKTK